MHSVNKLVMNAKKTQSLPKFNYKTPPEEFKLNLEVNIDAVEKGGRQFPIVGIHHKNT